MADGLARLVEHSLLVAAPGAETRYRMLETIRQYGADEKERHGELDDVRRRHLAWSLATIRALDARTDVELGAGLARADLYPAWQAEVDLVIDDARSAVQWAAARPEERSGAIEGASRLASLCFTRGLLAECQRRYEQVADLAGPGAVRIEALVDAAGAALSRHFGNEALRLLAEVRDAALASRGPGPGRVRAGPVRRADQPGAGPDGRRAAARGRHCAHRRGRAAGRGLARGRDGRARGPGFRRLRGRPGHRGDGRAGGGVGP